MTNHCHPVWRRLKSSLSEKRWNWSILVLARGSLRQKSQSALFSKNKGNFARSHGMSRAIRKPSLKMRQQFWPHLPARSGLSELLIGEHYKNSFVLRKIQNKFHKARGWVVGCAKFAKHDTFCSIVRKIRVELFWHNATSFALKIKNLQIQSLAAWQQKKFTYSNKYLFPFIRNDA